MANVLPIKKRKRIKRQYALRLIAATLFATSAAFIIGVVLLVPNFIMSQARLTANASVQEGSDDSFDKDKYKDMKKTVKLVNTQIESVAELVDVQAGSYISEVTSVRQEHKEGITITTIQYTKDKNRKEPDTLRVSGIAKDRASLSKFSSALRGSALFVEVDLPLSDLANSTEVPFAITITL